MKSENSTPTILMPMAAEWFVHLAVTGRSPATIEGDGHLLRRFERFLIENGRLSLEAIRPVDVDAWRADLVQKQIGAATVAAMIGRIDRFLGWLHGNGCTRVNTAFGAHHVKGDASTTKCPSEGEIQRLLESVSGPDPVARRDRAILEIAYATGARSEELCRLNLDAVKDTFVRLAGRTGRERMIPLTTAAVVALRVYLDEARPSLLRNAGEEQEPAVFLSSRSGRFSRRAIEIMVKERSCRCGVRLIWPAIRLAFSAHLLRGSAAHADVRQHWMTRNPAPVSTTGGRGGTVQPSLAARRLVNRMRKEGSLPEPPARFRPEADSWCEHMRARNLSPLTIRSACNALVRFGEFLDSRNLPSGCQEVSPSDLMEWLVSRVRAGHAQSYIKGMIAPVLCFFRWLDRRGEIFQNPAAGLRLPRFYPRMQPVPSEAEVNQLLASISLRSSLGIRDRAILETAYSSGLRISELAGMDLDSVDLHQGTVRVIGKGTRERVIPLTGAAVKILGLYLAGPREEFRRGRDAHPAFWLSCKDGERITRGGLQQVVEGRARDAGIKLTMHSLRRAFATHLLRHGASPWDLKLFLGHATFHQLKHYLRYAPEELRAAHHRSNLGR